MNTFYKGSIFLISLVTIVYFLQTLRLVYYHRKVLKVGNTIDNYTLFTTLVKFPKTDARPQWKTDLLYVYFVCTGGLLTKYKRYQEAHPEATFNRNPSPKFTTVKITGMTEIFSKASNNDTPMWTIDRITDIIFHEGFKPYLRGDQALNAPFKLIAGNIREVLDILALTLKEKAPHVKLTILDVDQPNRIPMRHTVERRPFYEN